ncbi:hypothetical protein [Vulgatibacter sp.]|uniref:hypothetical protein n=1 Tax=Vulgatibacter sp. TaxID=1971226 RepID=UPI00356A0172
MQKQHEGKPSIGAKAARSFIDFWDHEQKLTARNPSEEMAPSICDFAAHLGITVEEGLEACREAESFGLILISEPGFLSLPASK